MVCRLEELHRKEVISVKDGARLGFVGDVEFDTDTAKLSAIVVYGKLRWLGLLGREEDQSIRWEDIQMIGEETILVRHTSCIRKKRGFLSSFFTSCLTL